MSAILDRNGILRLPVWEDVPWLVHGFTTRRAGDFSSADGDVRLTVFGADGMRLRTVRQVHSARLYTVSGSSSPDGQLQTEAERPQADGLLTQDAGNLLAVRTAENP